MDKTINLGGSVNNLHDKLSLTQSEHNEKDDLVMKHAKVAEQAIAGWEKAEAEAAILKQELDEALRQRIAAEERISDLDAALKECMQQLRFNREEHEQRINDAVMHIFRDHEHEWMLLEEKLGETSKRLAKLDFENSHLTKTLQAKEKLIEELRKYKSQVEADFNKLMARLDSEEKDNLGSADAKHKQNTDSIRKIVKLEKECQRLRLLVHKRLPRFATVSEMKIEVLGKESDEFNRQMVDNFTSHDSPSKRINFLVEKLYSVEEENMALKESITKKNNEIHSLRTMGEHADSNLWGFSNGETPIELARSTFSQDQSLTSFSEYGHEDEVSCAGSWASALITELEHFTNRNSKGTTLSNTVPGMNLMDDFAEMEKLARVSIHRSFESSDVPSRESNGQELFPHNHSSSSEAIQENKLSDISIGNYPSWVRDVLSSVLRQSRSTQRNPEEILEEARIALTRVCHSLPGKVADARENSGTSSSIYPKHVCPVSDIDVSPRAQSDVSKSICRVIELIEGIDQPSSKDYNPPNSSTGYMVRVLQWKSSELRDVLQRFVHTCNDLVNGKADLETFPGELSSALEWIFNHCFSIQDVSSMRNTVKKHFDWDESESESESHMEEIQLKLKDENMILKQKVSNMESVQKDLERKLQLATEKTEELLIQLRKAEEIVGSSQTKILPDMDSRLTVARNELNTACQNSLSLELELENKISRCHELETTCIELQLQLDSVAEREVAKHDKDEVDGKLGTEWEMTAASEKLAECQETILNLGKQLKSLASPNKATESKSANHRCSLLDKMVSEDNANIEEFISDIPSMAFDLESQVKSREKLVCSNVAIVNSKRCGGGVSLLRKIVLRRKRETGTKALTMLTS